VAPRLGVIIGPRSQLGKALSTVSETRSDQQVFHGSASAGAYGFLAVAPPHRVRLALNLRGLRCEQVIVDLRKE
jgi:hypothetical protein